MPPQLRRFLHNSLYVRPVVRAQRANLCSPPLLSPTLDCFHATSTSPSEEIESNLPKTSSLSQRLQDIN
jgi:hypothetical protein